jgi:8-oxo-dGTP pyrophosphatase MutT (NUDIX family)
LEFLSGRGGVDRQRGVMKNSAKVVRGPERSQKRSQSERAARKRFRALSATDRPDLPILGTEAARKQPLVQSGVLAFRRLENGDVAVLLVKKPRSNNWGIPKGNAVSGLTLSENAAKEAFEEAGVKGRAETHSSGTYRAVKRMYGMKLVVEVSVYLLEVFETATKWPEKGEREIKWCSPHEAAILLHEPLLAELCGRLIRQRAR